MKILDHGELELEASLVSDLDVVNAAKVSLHKRADEMGESEVGILNFLLKNRHGTPFEHGYMRFRVKAPLFVFREWHRHRIGHSYNEWSARYSKLEPEFYMPETVVTQVGKPGSYTFEPVSEETQEETRRYLLASYNRAYGTYQHLLYIGVSKQQARIALPVATYSEMIWSCNPRSMMHFLGLRNEPSAQDEIRAYARAAESVFAELMPVTYKAFVDNGRVAP